MIVRAEKLYYHPDRKGIFSRPKDRTILKNISFNVEKGEILGIAGESGSGKTSLAKIIAGLNKPSSGKIFYNFPGERNDKTGRVQMLFQNNSEIINPFRRVEDIIKETIIKRYGKNDTANRIKKIVSSVNIPDKLLRRRGLELSGGEQQRTALARAIAAGPDLLLLDEPFSAQDPESQLNLLYLFKKINKEFGITLICISHHTWILRKLCSYILIMYKGEIVEKGSTEDVFKNPLHPYTRYLLSAESYNLTAEELLKRDNLFIKNEQD